MTARQNEHSFRDQEKYPLGHSASCNPTYFSKLQYRVDAIRRAIHRALQALEKLKAEAAAAPAPVVEPADPSSLSPSPQTISPQIGFVLAPPVAAPPQPAPAAPSPGPHSSPTSMSSIHKPNLATPTPLHKVESRIA